MTGRLFIGEDIDVTLPAGCYARRDPPAPLAFSWRGETHVVRGVAREWWDFGRLSRRQRGYGEGYHRRAPRTGSYGMGRHYFLVDTAAGTFLLYYDRRPCVSRPGGSWVLSQQVQGRRGGGTRD